MKGIQIPDAHGVPFSITPDRGSVGTPVHIFPAGYEVSLKKLFRVRLGVVDKIFINQSILRGLRFAQKATIELELTLSKKVCLFLRLVNLTFKA